MKIQVLCIVLVLGQALAASRDRNDKPYKVVCYWGSWSAYGNNEGKFAAEDINPHICTHVNYAFAKLDGNKIAVEDPYLDSDLNMLTRFNKFTKSNNPHLSTLISIGGWTDGSTKYSNMVASANHRQEFIHSVLDFLKKYDFDGLDIDWEYPAFKADKGGDRELGRAQDKHDFIELLKELKKAFEADGYILSAAVGSGKYQIDHAYDVVEISKHLDYVNYMTYDFHGIWEQQVGHTAPLHPLAQQSDELTVEFAVDYWIKLGGDPKKLILGMPLYGLGFVLAKAANGDFGSATDGGFDSQTGYNEICLLVKANWTTKWNDAQRVPYAFHANQWIGYDNVRSITEKVNYLKSKNLGGGMVWSVESDDFLGLCKEGKYPLIKTISKLLNNVDGPDLPSRSMDDFPKDHFNCNKAGFFANAGKSDEFHQCVALDGGHFYAFSFRCPHGTHYNQQESKCV